MAGGGGEGYSCDHGLPRTCSEASGVEGRPSLAALGADGNLPAQIQGRGHASAGNYQQPAAIREQDRFMPIANVIRIMRKVLPTHAKISDDAKETIQECVSEYISFVTSEANERCQREQRKTITAEDVLWAMSKLGFDDYVEPLTLYLRRYRELEGEHRGALRGEPLTDLKHRNPLCAVHHPPHPQLHSGTDIVDGPQLFNLMPPPPPPMPSFVVPPASAAPQNLHQTGFYSSDGMAGYYFGMYGNGPDGTGSSSHQAPWMPGFDHNFAPYK